MVKSKPFDIDRMVVGLVLKLKKDMIDVSNLEERAKIKKQIESLPNTRPEKEWLLEEFQLKCDISDHKYESNIEQAYKNLCKT